MRIPVSNFCIWQQALLRERAMIFWWKHGGTSIETARVHHVGRFRCVSMAACCACAGTSAAHWRAEAPAETIRKGRPGSRRSGRGRNSWAGPRAAICGSTSAGADDVVRIRRDAAELVALAPDIILAGGGQVMAPLLEATRTVPIVFTQPPIRSAPALSPAWRNRAATRPASPTSNTASARNGWSCSKQVAPHVTRAAVLRDPTNPAGTGQWGAIQAVAPSLGVELTPSMCAKLTKSSAPSQASQQGRMTG